MLEYQFYLWNALSFFVIKDLRYQVVYVVKVFICYWIAFCVCTCVYVFMLFTLFIFLSFCCFHCMLHLMLLRWPCVIVHSTASLLFHVFWACKG